MNNNFKFLKSEQEKPLEPIPLPLSPDETIIHYWNDGDFRNILYAKVISWANGNHAFGGGWTRHAFVGTMERFFYNKLSVPIIESIEALIPDGATFTQGDGQYLPHIHFHFEVRIIYYEPI